MRALIYVEEPFGIHAGIDLRRRQAGVAEQFLDGPQIAAAAEEVGGEGMAQCMRRRRLRQVERRTQLAHFALHDRRLQRPAARAAEQRSFAVQVKRAEPAVLRDSLAGDWE